MKPVCKIILLLIVATKSYSQDNGIAVNNSSSPGSLTTSSHEEEIAPYINGFAKALIHDKWNLIDRQGNPVSTTGFDAVRNFVNHLAAVKQNDKWGFINEKGVVVIPAQYETIYDFTEQVTAGYKDGKWFLVNKQGSITRPLSVDVFYGFEKGIARISSKDRWGTMNTRGDILSLENQKTAAAVNTVHQTLRTDAAMAGTCPVNIGFEAGTFANWKCFTGSVEAIGTGNAITVSPSSPVSNRHTLVPKTATPVLDPYGLFPINPPDGSNYAIRLGNNINGAEAERVTYQINVPADAVDASITYRFAVVFEDPGHETYEQPRFIARVLDVAANKYLACANNQYIATAEIPGFFSSTVDNSVKCKPWSSVYINLSAYAGKTLILEFTTADCTKGKHWGYAYVDVGDCDITASAQYQCNPDIATLTGPPGFAQYRWFDDSRNVMIGQGEHLVLNPAPKINSLSVLLIPFNGFGCSDTLQVPITPNFPVADAGPDKSICIGGTVALGTTAATGLKYSWSPGITLVDSTRATPRGLPTTNTTYVVTATNIASGCMVKDTVNVVVNPIPVPEFATGAAQCFIGNSFIFQNHSSVPSGNLTYDWRFGDGDSSKQTAPAHTFSKPGTYLVKLSAIGNGNCVASINHPVTINPNPTIRTIDNFAICKGKTAQLRASGGQSYTWSPAQEVTCATCPATSSTPANTSTYTVIGFNSAGCPGYDTIVVTVHQPIDITVSPDRVMCDGQTINLQANGSAAYYRWSPATGLNSYEIPNPVVTPHTTTQYRVIGYDGHNCFTDTGYINVTVNPTPRLDLGPDLVLSTGTIHSFASNTKNGPMKSWHWSPSENLDCSNCPKPTTEVKRDMTYIASVENIYGCTAVDTINIRTFCKNSQVFIPNAFTPDGDGVNDILMVRGKGIALVKSFRIYSRWGELVFEKTNFAPNDPNFGWNGKIKGVTGAAEVYVFTAEVVCENDLIYTYKGNTSILK